MSQPCSRHGESKRTLLCQLTGNHPKINAKSLKKVVQMHDTMNTRYVWRDVSGGCCSVAALTAAGLGLLFSMSNENIDASIATKTGSQK